MKNFLSIIILLLTLESCGHSLNTTIVATQIKKDYQEQIDNNYATLAGLGVNLDDLDFNAKPQVTNVSIVHLEGNQYIGIAEIEIAGFIYKQNINIVIDGYNYYWEVQ